FFVFFFFQAEDGIRDKLVTEVQTCALPISHGVTPPARSSRAAGSRSRCARSSRARGAGGRRHAMSRGAHRGWRSRRHPLPAETRSEERRAGKGGRYGTWPRWCKETTVPGGK